MQHVQLKVTGGKQDGLLIPLSQGKFLVGRGEDCHLRPGSELVSRHHCVFTVDEFTARLRDLGSTNGTLINGERVHGEVQIGVGDRVIIGKLEFEVLVEERPDGDQPTASEHQPANDTVAFSSSDTNSGLPNPLHPGSEIPNSGDSTMLPQPMMPQPGALPPDQYPQQVPGMYPQQVPGMYPQQVPGMYPQQMPGMYPQQPGYPMAPLQPGQYPQQVQFPPQQVPMQPMPYPPQAPEAQQGMAPGSTPVMPVKLPDPSTTGVKTQPDPAPAPQDSPDEEQPAD